MNQSHLCSVNGSTEFLTEGCVFKFLTALVRLVRRCHICHVEGLRLHLWDLAAQHQCEVGASAGDG